jgi:hypothetical protein
MAMVDPFSPDAFSLVALTAAINNVKYAPTRLAQLGLFEEQGISTLDAAVEERDGVLAIVDVAPRGAPGQPVGGETRKIHSFRVPHLPERGALRADEVQGVRAFGSENQAEVLTTRLNERLATLRRNIDYTLESHRLSALMGSFIDANGASVSLFTTFGVTQQTLSFVLGTATTKIRSKCLTVLANIESALDGIPFSGVRALCGATFFDNLITHANVEATYLNQQQASELRGDPRQEINFGGIVFERYRGTSAVKVGDNDAYAVPVGVPGLFLTRFAPADYAETVNTLGLPYYAKSEPLKFGKGYEIEAQSNPLNLCTRPASIIKLTVS